MLLVGKLSEPQILVWREKGARLEKSSCPPHYLHLSSTICVTCVYFEVFLRNSESQYAGILYVVE